MKMKRIGLSLSKIICSTKTYRTVLYSKAANYFPVCRLKYIFYKTREWVYRSITTYNVLNPVKDSSSVFLPDFLVKLTQAIVKFRCHLKGKIMESKLQATTFFHSPLYQKKFGSLVQSKFKHHFIGLCRETWHPFDSDNPCDIDNVIAVDNMSIFIKTL